MKRDYMQLQLFIWPRWSWPPVIDPIAFVGQVAGNHGRSARVINVTSPSTRWPGFGEIAYVGTEAGLYDIGIIRVISSSSTEGKITVCENEIEWRDGLYIYAPWLFAPTVRLQRIVEAGGNPVVYKDYDIAFDASKYLPPKANLSGPVVCGEDWVEFSLGGIPMQSGTSIASLSLTCPGAEIQEVSSGVYRAKFQPGFWYITGIVTDSVGQIGVIHRPVFALMQPDSDRVAISELRGEVNNGWEARFAFPYAEGEILPYSLIVLTGLARPFVGWVINAEYSYESRVRTAEVRALSATAWLEQLRCLGIHIEDTASPSSWYHIGGLNIRRAIHHLLDWHSTFNLLSPVIYSPDCDRAIKIQQFQDSNIGQELTKLMNDASLVFAEQMDGTVIIFRPPIWNWNRSETAVPVNSGPVRHSPGQQLGLLRCGGFAYGTPLLSRYPGDTPTDRGQKREEEGLIVADQNDLNQQCGLRWSQEAAGEIYATLAEPGDNLDFGNYWVDFGTDSLGSIVGWVRTKALRSVGGTVVTEVTAAARNAKVLGETMTVPSAPPVAPPEWPIPEPPAPPPFAPSGLALVRTPQYIFRTFNVYSNFPRWEIVFDLADYETNSESRKIVDFRYIERGGSVAVAVISRKGLYITSDVSATPVVWTQVLNEERLKTITQADLSVECRWLITFVQSGNYLGIFVNTYNSDYTNWLGYLYTTDWFGSWNYRGIWAVGVYTRYPWGVFNTGGTDEIGVYASTGIYGSAMRFYRSLDGGNTWAYIASLNVLPVSLMKVAKPWQWGKSGVRLYAAVKTYRSVGWRASRSLDNGVSFTDTIPDPNVESLGQNLEVWTYDPYLVYAALYRRSTEQVDWYRTQDGGNTWVFISTIPIALTPALEVTVHGNPANKNEWTVCSRGTAISGNMLVQTLDGGQSWDSLMGDWYTVHPAGNWDGEDYLIIPPFRVVSRRE
ncbi:sialidase family protein [Thermogutta sp.]|uniref:sialidase family protein n=1 Tax=Thermogutta sp. TaxID=1962930 RepID=UPI00321FFC70